MYTIVASSTTMSWAMAMTASASQRLGSAAGTRVGDASVAVSRI